MIDIIDTRNQDGYKYIENILNRNQMEFEDVNSSVMEIIKNVKKDGDTALKKYTSKFDGVEIEELIVTKEEIEEGYNSCDKKFIDILCKAKNNIERYHSKQLANSWIDTSKEGITLGQINSSIEKVGVYVPGGTAPYPSTLLMNVIPAKVAGVKKVVMVTPPSKEGKIDKSILAAAKIAGVDKIFKVGGAHGVAALAFGTESIPKVHKVVGPGNIYVTMAKRMVYGYVDIDMIAGPSEILILADEYSNPEYIAADMLSQAEHDTLASSILVTTSIEVGKKVRDELIVQTTELSRKNIIKKSIEDFGAIIVVENLREGIKLANRIAPEHLELMVEKPFELINKVENAGAIFLGAYSPEPLGDYFAGPNHTLPTSGTAKFFSPLSVDDFIKKSSLIYYDKDALSQVKDDITEFAEKEGLTAHANSIKVRFK